MLSAPELQTEESFIYSSEEIGLLDPRLVPHHVGIIMDGNRRWAKQQGLHPSFGHWEGARILVQIVKAAKELGIKELTVYAFSTENWQRPKEEIALVFAVCEQFMKEQCLSMKEGGIRLAWIGETSVLPLSLQDTLDATQKETRRGNKMVFSVALNYGGRDEIRRACVALGKKIQQGRLLPEEITEELVAKHMDTAPLNDLDLLIRTGGEKRVSNFMLWKMHYAELFFCKTPWPKFSTHHFLEAIIEFQRRKRNRGA